MGAQVRYVTADGNTVPYPPLFDEVRRNHGFVDTRGKPERIAEIPEAKESSALAALLSRLALPGSKFVSLGCDLGQHDEPKARLSMRRVAGGYVQVIAGREADYTLEFLQKAAKALETGLKARVGTDRWQVNLQLSPVLLQIDEEVEIQSIWIWFYAKASTSEGAVASRERLIQTIEILMNAMGA